MAVNPDAPITILQVTYRKEDNGKPIRVTAGGCVLFDGVLKFNGDSDTYDVKYIIPKTVIAANVRTVAANHTEYDVIDIGFSAGNAEESAKVCDFIYMNAVKPNYEYDNDVAYFVDCGDAVTSKHCRRPVCRVMSTQTALSMSQTQFCWHGLLRKTLLPSSLRKGSCWLT